jgi:hypothetical protein
MSTISKPYNFTSGTTIQSAQVNSNFDTIYNDYNGNITNANIATGAGIDLAKIAQTSLFFILRAAANNTLASGTTGDTVPRVTFTSDGGLKFGAGSASALDLLIKRNSSTQFAFRNAADNADRDILCGALTASGALSAASGSFTAALGISSGGSNNSSLSVVQGTVYYGDGSKLVGLGPGTSGQFLKTQGVSANPVWDTLTIPTFTSTDQTITAAGTLTIAHGLGSTPKKVWCDLVCQTAQANYSIGEVVKAYIVVPNRGASVIADATNINIRYAAGDGTNAVYALLDKTTGVNTDLTSANWKTRWYAQ